MAGDLIVSLESEYLPGAQTFEVEGVEQISKPFDFRVRIATAAQGAADADAAVAMAASLVFRRGEEELRRVAGIIASVRDTPLGDNRTYIAYDVHFVPRLWRLSMTQTTDIYMDLSVPDIIKKKLVAAGLTDGADFDFRLKGKYPPREFVVQYQETDLNFISRLAEHIGIYFFFEYGDVEKVVFCDSKTVIKPIAEPKDITYLHTDAAEVAELRVFDLRSVTTALPNKYIVRDYNYRSPGMDLKASATVLESGTGEIIEYGAHFKTPEDGAKIARVRAEELRSRRIVFSGGSNAHNLAAGAHFKVEGHHRGDVELLLTRVRHSARQPVFNLPLKDERAYRNEFSAIPKETEFRPSRDATKPVVAGVVTGIVDAGQKSNYAELDGEGRYKIKFMYDTAERGEGQASRPVRMAQPSSGPGYGMHFPLRPGIEVILSCVNGDPDRPIIAGTVPNPETGSPVTAGNQNRNIIKTGGGTEMNFDDTAGSNRLKISVPHADTHFQLGAPNSPENGAMLSTAESYSAYAGIAATQVSNVSNLFAASAKFLASTDITSFAGVSNALDGVENAMGVVNAAADFAKDAAGLPKAWKDVGAKRASAKAKSYGVAVAKASAETARAKAALAKDTEEERKEVAQAQYELDVAEADLAEYDRLHPGEVNKCSPGRTPIEQKRDAAKEKLEQKKTKLATVEKSKGESVARAEANEKKAKADLENDPDAAAAAAESAAMDAQAAADDQSTWGQISKGVGIGMDAVKTVTKTTKAVQDAAKAAKTLFGAASTVASTVAKGGAAGMAAGAIAAGTGFGGIPRVSGAVGALSKAWNIQGATGSAAVIGVANAVVASPNATSVTAGVTALLGAGAKAIVHSPAAAELTGVARALVTSGALIDLKSGARFKTFSGALTTINAGASIVASAGAAVSISAKGQMKLKAGPKIEAKATNIKLDGSSKVDVKTTDFGVKASSNVKMSGSSSTEIKTGGVSMTLKGGVAKIGASSGFSRLQNGQAFIKGGSSSLELKGGGAKVSGPKVTLSGSGGVRVSGSKIDLG